jgi:hypothetical protein
MTVTEAGAEVVGVLGGGMEAYVARGLVGVAGEGRGGVVEFGGRGLHSHGTR